MAGLCETTLDVFAVHNAADRLAAESLAQGVEFGDEGGKYLVRMQQVHCDEVFGDQDFAKRRIGIDAVAEQTAGEIMALAPSHDNARLAPTARRGRILGEVQPSGQSQSRDGLTDQRINRTDLVAGQGFNGKWRHWGSPEFCSQGCPISRVSALIQIKAPMRRAAHCMNES